MGWGCDSMWEMGDTLRACRTQSPSNGSGSASLRDTSPPSPTNSSRSTGHNYDVMVEVGGALTDESWVIDFSLLKRLTRGVCEELDHKFLLQMESRVLSIRDEGTHFEVQYKSELSYRAAEA